ncbi:hypothetical protein HMPREF9547_00283 [Escherichia coli MS 175-1]|nr:hypothetical protein HMPREF9551_01713 [Escherichia coli MS 196-1]EFJ68461.1 hypothetical protein HMPREF9547_00283 [Escherichia coli MS 175-1]EFJ97042.1 hypothetical protein HMPREF9540_02908 [Escherichia coli MS 115-1]EFK01432.1 hypothetical protein HMPREF9548_03847 [Escherichia coli MS 182-1]EFK14957.1 hypothetical protein HMPREF9541_02693 [Escherichia coli MS 116-1]EFK48935.1 hypothetical protein HMPREF9345_04643 [Escherichia coli MS 107-1]EFK73395.1 hypothetical protein HMPREF9535_02667 
MPHPAIGAQCLMRCLTHLIRPTMGTGSVGRIRRLRRIRQE